MVTIPKSRMADIEAEEEMVAKATKKGQSWQFYWEVGRCPKGWDEGCGTVRRIYFLWDGAVRAWHAFQGAKRHGDRWRLYMDAKIHNITPIPMEPFMGYRWFHERQEVR